MPKKRTKDPRSMRSLREKVMAPERMQRLYAKLLLYPSEEGVPYGDLEDTEEKELWLMMRYNILRTQATTLRAYLDLESKKAYAQLNKVYAARTIDFDAEELLRDYTPTNCFKYYEPSALLDFIHWYMAVLSDAMKSLDVKPSGFDSDKFQYGEHFWDNINERGDGTGTTHGLVFCGASTLLLLYGQFSDPTRQTTHPVACSFQVGHSAYERIKKALQEAREAQHKGVRVYPSHTITRN